MYLRLLSLNLKLKSLYVTECTHTIVSQSSHIPELIHCTLIPLYNCNCLPEFNGKTLVGPQLSPLENNYE